MQKQVSENEKIGGPPLEPHAEPGGGLAGEAILQPL
jgi:hypothetical protein